MFLRNVDTAKILHSVTTQNNHVHITLKTSNPSCYHFVIYLITFHIHMFNFIYIYLTASG
jgi:hypothetical protein